eukprot:3606206-Lingulodinium_polyedra.AAC.1
MPVQVEGKAVGLEELELGPPPFHAEGLPNEHSDLGHKRVAKLGHAGGMRLAHLIDDGVLAALSAICAPPE